MRTINKKLLTLILILATLTFGGVSIFSMGRTILASAKESATISKSDVSSSENTSPSGMYFLATANSAPFDSGWGLRYKPKTSDAIKLIRGNETKNVGNTGAETIVKYEEKKYFIESWAVGQGSNGWQVGDVYLLNTDVFQIMKGLLYGTL